MTRYFVLYLGWTLDFMPRSWPTEPPQGQGERAVGRIVSILHVRFDGPIPLEPELAHELEALAEAHTHLEAVSERLAAARPADRKS